MTNQTKALLAVLGAAVFGSGSVIYSKIGLKEIPPFSFMFLRFLIASLFILPFYLKSPAVTSPAVATNFSLFVFQRQYFLFAFGISLTTATVSQIIYSLVPVITAILAHFLVKEKFNQKKIAGIALGFVGLLVIIGLPQTFTGNLLLFIGACSYSFYPVLSKKIQAQYSPWNLTVMFIFTTTVLAGLLSLTELNQAATWINSASRLAWYSLFFVAIVGTIIYYWLTQRAIKDGSAVVGSMILYLQPVTTYLWAAAILGERLTLPVAIGGILTIGGAYLVTKTNHNE